MENRGYLELNRIESAPEKLEATIAYVAENLQRFLRKRESVLIYFPKGERNSIGSIFEEACLRCDTKPVFWDADMKWKSLLIQSFYSRATTIIGPPLAILSLSKLAKATNTPLFIRNAVTAGYPCMDWMIDGLIRGLDCRTWGCFGAGVGSVVSGFSCGQSFGVHIREDVYDIDILDKEGNVLPEGEEGVICIKSKTHSDKRVLLQDHGCLNRNPCPCGRTSLRLVNIHPMGRFQGDVLNLYQELHSWTSILDCKVTKGSYGLELELVVFPGEKLPKLPTCAKLVIRPWDPDMDIPLDYQIHRQWL